MGGALGKGIIMGSPLKSLEGRSLFVHTFLSPFLDYEKIDLNRPKREIDFSPTVICCVVSSFVAVV